MPNRGKDSTLSGSSASTPIPGIAGDIINPRISPEEFNQANNSEHSYTPSERPPAREVRGSGSDRNSDSRRLNDRENYLDKLAEDTFPASDPPSTSPITGVGERNDDPSHLPSDFKDNKAAQFEYGRRSQKSTHHFDTTSKRLEHGNPDVGEVDLGTIEADRPAQADDNDHFDSAEDDERSSSSRSDV